jgi:hypothetical protein
MGRMVKSSQLEKALAMSSETKKQSTESFWYLPWEEDTIDVGESLEAIHNGDVAFPALYLRSAESIDRNVIRALANKLDPRHPNLSSYVLRKKSGRPRKRAPVNPDDPVEILVNKGDPKDIADYLRHSENPDRRILEWMADRLDRSTADGSHFVVKKPRGKPPRQSRWQTLLVGKQGMEMLGLKVERKRREFGKLEAALHYFSQENKDWPNRVSRSKARRAYDAFLEAKSARKNPRV